MDAHIGLDAPPCRTADVPGCSTVLTLSHSDKSALTADNCKDSLLRSDAGGAWTDEKHNSYLNQLEVSFVTQLHQAKGLVGKSYELKNRYTHISQNDPTNDHNSSGQFTVLCNGCWQNIKSERAELLSHTSADSHCQAKNVCHPPFLNSSGTHKRRKDICHGLVRYPQRCSTSIVYQECTVEVTKAEGTGQNFSEEDDQVKSNIESQAKRLKTALANSPTLDQIVPQ